MVVRASPRLHWGSRVNQPFRPINPSRPCHREHVKNLSGGLNLCKTKETIGVLTKLRGSTEEQEITNEVKSQFPRDMRSKANISL